MSALSTLPPTPEIKYLDSRQSDGTREKLARFSSKFQADQLNWHFGQADIHDI